MKAYEATHTNVSGTFPNTAGVNASGPSATDGTEYIAEGINDHWGGKQDLMDRAGLTPDGVTEAVGTSQFMAALDILFLAENMISGLAISNNVTDPDHDIDIATGRAMDSTNAYLMRLTSGLIKQIDASWAAGTNAGGLFTGTVANDTWYHMFLIRKDSDGTLDAGFDVSINAANIPVGYTAYRRIGSVLTDGSANILAFTAYEVSGGGLDYEFNTQPLDLNLGTLPDTNRNNITISTPLDVEVIAKINARISSGVTSQVWVGAKSAADVAASATYNSLNTTSGTSTSEQGEMLVKTDTLSQICYRGSVTGVSLGVQLTGFVDSRI
jgi:hypothetical protein